MLPPLSGVEREVQHQLGVQRVRDPTKRGKARFVLSTLESRDRGLRHPAAPTQLRLRKPVLDPEGNELACDLLVRIEFLERFPVLRIPTELSVEVCQSSRWHSAQPPFLAR